MTDADEGKAIKVRVTFTDDAGNAESLTSDASAVRPTLGHPQDSETPPKSTATREAREAQGEQEAAETPLTAAILDAPESHDGEKRFTFELRFSEDPKEDFSYKTLRDHAFTVTRGTVAGARRLDGNSDTRNIKWEISVTPDSNADVTVELPATTDCDAQGAICADGRDKKLSSPLKFTVSGPPLTASSESVPTSHNGSGEFRIRIALSEAPKSGFSYTTMRDHAFTVTGGSVTGARRLVSGKNLRWEISRQPGLQRGRDDHSARHHGLRRAGGHLRRRRQEAVQPFGAHRQRAGLVEGNEKSKHIRTGEAGAPTGTRISRGMSHTGMGSLPSHRRGTRAVLWERFCHASTAHTLRRGPAHPSAPEGASGERPIPLKPLSLPICLLLRPIGTSCCGASSFDTPGPLSQILTRRSDGSIEISTLPFVESAIPAMASVEFWLYSR